MDKNLGWKYGSLASDILMGLKMHAKGWSSIYCTLSSPAFKGTAPTNLSDRLNRVLQWSLGSIEVLFSSHYPVCNGSRLRILERMAYVNATFYPLTSIPLVTYCLPCNKISLMGSLWLMLLFLSTFAAGILEMSWSGFGTQEWWNHQQFRVIGGVSA